MFDPMDRETVRRLFEPYSPTPLTDADCAEIDRTMRGFFTVLLKWRRYSRALRAGASREAAAAAAEGPEVDRPDGPPDRG